MCAEYVHNLRMKAGRYTHINIGLIHVQYIFNILDITSRGMLFCRTPVSMVEVVGFDTHLSSLYRSFIGRDCYEDVLQKTNLNCRVTNGKLLPRPRFHGIRG